MKFYNVLELAMTCPLRVYPIINTLHCIVNLSPVKVFSISVISQSNFAELLVLSNFSRVL